MSKDTTTVTTINTDNNTTSNSSEDTLTVIRKEADNTLKKIRMMYKFLDCGQTEIWCKGSEDFSSLIRANIKTQIEEAGKYYYTLLDMIDMYGEIHRYDDPDDWKDSIKEKCKGYCPDRKGKKGGA